MPNYVYTSDDGDTKPIRLSAATASAAGFTQGATNDTDFVKVSKSSREFGQRPRGLRLARNLGTDEVPNMRYKFLPIPTLAEYTSAANGVGNTKTVDGVAWQIIAKLAEDN